MTTNEAPLAGRTALVTGAGRGIGRAIALNLAGNGAEIVINYRRDADAAGEVVELIERDGGSALAVQASIDDDDAVRTLASTALDRFGQIDIVVANAGLASRGKTIADSEPEEFERLMSTHTFSLQKLLRYLLPGMRKARRGDVVAISSSEVTSMNARGAPYNMAKVALEALILTLAKEEGANGIRANIVAPGLVVTDMGSRAVKALLGVDDIEELDADQPFGRVTRPGDVADAVSFLVSGSAHQVTGQRIVVDGGRDASPTQAMASPVRSR